MGIIKRQSLKASLVNYIGVFLGVIFMVFIFPHLIDVEYLGLINLLQSLTYMLVSLPMMGLSFVLMRYHSSWKNSNTTAHFNAFSFIAMACNLIVFAIAFYLFRNPIIDTYKQRSALFIPYFFLVVPLVIIQVYSQYIETYATLKLRVAVPAFLREIVTRVMLISLVFLFAYQYINEQQFFYGFVFIYFFAFAILFLYAIKKLNLTFGSIRKFVQIKELKTYVAYSASMLLLVLFTNIVNFIDGVFLSAYLGLGALGIYARPLLLGQMIQVPYRAISLISIPIIREAILENNIKKVKELNKDISINLFLIGCFLFTLLISNADNIFLLFPSEYHIAKNVLFIIAFGRLFDMAFGLNSEILNYSKYYSVLIWFSAIMMVVTIVANIVLIPRLGLDGAAFAVTISLISYNLLKTWFIWKKYQFHCFSIGYLSLLGLTTAVLLLAQFIPNLNFIQHHMFINSLLNIACKSAIVSVMFLVPAYALKVSPDFNDFLKLVLTGKIFKGGHKMEHL